MSWQHVDAETRQVARVKNGLGRWNTTRARKLISQDVREVADILLKAIRDIESGDLDTAKENANANVSRAYVTIHESALIDSRIDELEARITERATAGGVVTRASVLKKLGALEAAISPTPVQPLALVEVHKVPDDDRER